MDELISVPPTHPGEVLYEDFLKPLGMSSSALALALRVPANRINDIVRGKRAVSADTALRLARYFGGSADFWLRLQAMYDRDVVDDRDGESIRRDVIPRVLV